MTTKTVRMPGSIAMIFVAVFLFVFASAAFGQTLPNETPQKFEPTNDGFEYSRRDVMIPMRDGVKLHTVIIVPKGARGAPILLTRTPYNATTLTSHAESSHLGPILNGYDNATDVIVEGGYIRVVQDVRGKHGSEGDYVMNRPLRGPLNPTPVDHATDTYDTVDWLVKSVPECNGRVGVLGIAYDKLLARQPLKVPVMLVHSLWDQEDIYGAPAVYKALEPKDAGNDKVFPVIGPWHHGQMIGNGSSLGAVKFGSDTARYFRQQILRPFLDQHLKDGAPKADIAPVTAFETGTNAWRRLSAWPPKAEGDKAVRETPLYLRAGLKLSFEAPARRDVEFEEYVSDPAKPVPFRARPIQPMGYEQGNTWAQWLVDDQREASGRPDVVAFLSDTLTAPMKISGEPVANLVASTSGTDADWVVKLIDVYPDAVAGDAVMGGYQLMIAADIFRGRYREGFDAAKPIAPNKPLLYRFSLPTANHVF